jgi:galactoside O-acetyltransferase
MLSRNALEAIGFASIGADVHISDKASFYGAGRIKIGNHVRIDDYCVLSAGEGGIEIGNHIHIAVYTSLIGAGKITLADFCNISSRVSIYSSSDDYTGGSMTNPTVPDEFKNVQHAPVALGRHVIIGCGTVILPGITLEEGVAVGALSLVNKNCKSFGTYVGNPARRIKDRKRDLLVLERQLIAKSKQNC